MNDLSTDETKKDVTTDDSNKENGVVRNLYWQHFGGAGCSGGLCDMIWKQLWFKLVKSSEQWQQQSKSKWETTLTEETLTLCSDTQDTQKAGSPCLSSLFSFIAFPGQWFAWGSSDDNGFGEET